jgi:hypothetical protein
MTLDDTAAAYGLVQVVFADVTDHLAFATFIRPMAVRLQVSTEAA